MSKKYKVGIVGLSRGQGFVKVFAAHPEVEVTALCDIDEQKLAKTGPAFNLPESRLYKTFDEFLNAPMDIVMIATPIAFHADHTIRSLESGRHVLCEQTAAYTVEDCAKIVETVKKTRRKYMMGENYTYFHYVSEWRKIVAEGKIGKVYYAEGEYIHRIHNLLVNKDTGEYYWRHNRPPIWYCAHTLGPILTLMEDRVVRGCGLTSGFTMYPEMKDHPGFLDFEIGLFQTAKGAVVKILRSQVAHRRHTVWYSLYGTKGHLENQRDEGNGLFCVEGAKPEFIPCTTIDPNAPEDAKVGGHGTSEYYMIREFLKSIEADSRPPIDVIRSMDFTLPGIIAHQSAMQNGRWLDVPQFNW